MINALRKVKKSGYKPIKVLRHSYLEIYRRLNKEINLRKIKDKFITVRDIRTGNLGLRLFTVHINPGEFYVLTLSIAFKI